MDNHHLVLGIAAFVATTTFLGLRYFRAPRKQPLRSWGWAGGATILAGEALLLFRHPLVGIYFTPLMWTGYLLLVDALVGSLTGHSRLERAPWQFLSLAFWSAPLWMIFEAYNLRLKNWAYVGLPDDRWLSSIGYLWSFATIWPAIFITADLVEALGPTRRQGKPRPAFSTASLTAVALVGLVFLLMPLLVPVRWGRYMFGFVWLGFVLLLDPLNYAGTGRSLLRAWQQGENARSWSLLQSGLICGVLWEFWNFWAAAKWIYVFPIWQDLKVFEMPLPGYLGFPPFALECFVMYEFLRTARDRLLGIRGATAGHAAGLAGPVMEDRVHRSQ